MAFLLHYTGTGHGHMAGFNEYVTIEDIDDEAELEEEIEADLAPGFKLESKTDIGDIPCNLPTSTVLVRR